MRNRIGLLFIPLLLCMIGVSVPVHAAPTAGATLTLKNQYGEVSKNWVLAQGSSSAIDINFIVDSTNGNGLGVRSIKSTAVSLPKVYMHTSSTPASGNPNPAPGFILVQLPGTYSAYIGGYTGFVEPLSGSSILVTTGVSAGGAYVITSVGTTTPAGFQSLGLPLGLTPTPGQSFIAPATVTTTGTGTLQQAVASGVDHIEVIGDPNQSVGATGGATIVLEALASGSATAPANNTVIGMRFVYQ